MSAGRFERQVRFAGLGSAGQARLEAGSALIVGCGALGGALAQSLVRSQMKMSAWPLVSPATRLLANEVKTTVSPAPLMNGSRLSPLA